MTENRKRPTQTRKSPTVKKKRKLRVLPTILISILFIGLIGVGATAGWIYSIAKDLPEWDEYALSNSQTSFMFDNEGEMFAELHAGESRTDVKFDQIPKHLIDCLVANEDARFYKHNGIDFIRVLGALKADILSGSAAQGASTITMQLARNAVLEDKEKKLTRKVQESLIAMQIEDQYSKDEILTLYLNEVFFGHQFYGIQSAANGYFGKAVSDLTLEESALLVGILPMPNGYSPLKNPEKAEERKDKALTELAKYFPEYENEVLIAKEQPIVLKEGAQTKTEYKHPWFTDYAIDEAQDILASLDIDPATLYTAGYRVYTTLNQDVQDAMTKAYENDANFPSSPTSDPVQSAMVSLDPSNGYVLGLIGGREHTNKLGFNRATDLKRQPGSVFKPIAVYSPMVELGYGSGAVANDVIREISQGTGKPYAPENYNPKYRGTITARTGLQHSINTVAVRFLQEIGASNGYDMAVKLGIPLSSKNDKNLSIALGGLTYGCSPLDIAGAYGAFANKGIYTPPTTITKIIDRDGNEIYNHKPSQSIAMKESTAYILTDMLKTVTTAGTGTNAKMPNRDVASKTGTTQLPNKPQFAGKAGNKDAWFAAYTPDYVGIVWMGYDQDVDENGKAQYLHQVYGGKYPAKIWKQVATVATQNSENRYFSKPEDVISVQIDTKSGMLPSELTPKEFISTELYLKGTEPTEVSDVWSYVTVCAETGEIATDNCPNVKTKLVYTPPKEPEINKIVNQEKALDYAYVNTGITCKKHGGEAAKLYEATICTDPSHKGKVYLANVPYPGSKGGCPQEYIVTKQFPAGKIPTEYCPIPSHQVDGEAATNPGENVGPEGTNVQPPTKIKAEVTGSDGAKEIKLDWVDEYNEPGTVKYEVARWTGSQNSPENKTTFESSFTSFADKNLASKVYYYQVRTVTKEGNSPWSRVIKVNAQ